MNKNVDNTPKAVCEVAENKSIAAKNTIQNTMSSI